VSNWRSFPMSALDSIQVLSEWQKIAPPKRGYAARSGALFYWARGASDGARGVVAFGLAGGKDGGTGACTLRPVVSDAGVVAVVRDRSPVIANTRNPARSAAPTIAGRTQPGLASIRGLSSIGGRASMFLRAMSSFGSFIAICGVLWVICRELETRRGRECSWSISTKARLA
jgi:hypothetical protein